MGNERTGRSSRLLAGLAQTLSRWRQRSRFRGSGEYWERRYRHGGSSGVGSWGDLAAFKAETLNGIVREHAVHSVIDFGCGDGSQLALANYPSYLGLDVSKTAVDLCRKRFAGDPGKRFHLYTAAFPDDVPPPARAQLALSVDVLYHLVEDSVFERHLRDVFGSADRLVVIYSSDFAREEPVPHVRHRAFTAWVSANLPGWQLRQRIPNRFPYREADGSGSLADFFVYERSR
jgi:SAM-dependent methyltransferase